MLKESKLIRLFKKIRSCLKQDQRVFIFFWTLLFYLATLLSNPNNKTLFIFIAFLNLGYYFYLRSLPLTLFLTFTACSIFQVGKTYIIELVPQNLIKSTIYPGARITAFTINHNNVISLIFLLLIIKRLIKKKLVLPQPLLFLILILYSVWIFASSYFYSLKPEISILFAAQFVEIILFLIFVKNFICFKKISHLIFACLASIISLEGILTIGQFINKSPLGSSIESTAPPLFGQALDENRFFYRPIGTFSHANELGNFIISYLLIFLALLYFNKLKKSHLYLSLIVLVLGLTTLVLSASRSAWISLILGFLIFTFILEKKWHLKINLNEIKTKYIYWTIFFLVIFSSLVLPWRLIQSFYSFEEGGGVSSRQKLTVEALALIKKYPLFGVGVAMAIPAMVNQNLTGIMPFFPESVHNGFLAMVLESGLPVLFFMILFLIVKTAILIKLIKQTRQNKLKILALALLCTEISLLTNMMFHPFQNLGTIIFINSLFNLVF